MIHDGINKDTYIETTDNVLKFFSPFQYFLKTGNSQPACLYKTVKTQKFENFGDIAVVSLKFWPIIDLS